MNARRAAEPSAEPPTGLRENCILAPFTTLGVGGPARWFLDAEDVETLRAGLEWARASGLPVFILGGGSNVVVADAGFPGLVIRMAMRGLHFRPENPDEPSGPVWATAAAGEPWDAFVAECVARGLAGIECLSGIPGTVGGAPIQNIGAYGQEVAETIARVEAINRATGGANVLFDGSDCGFGYRTSRFKHGADRDRFAVTSVTFRLTSGPAAAPRYGDITRWLEARGTAGRAGAEAPRLADIRDAVLAVRRAKAMVYEPDTAPDSRSCGSFFTNPIVTGAAWADAKALLTAAGIDTTSAPIHATGDGMLKLSAAWLMEASGLKKGQRHAGAALSRHHILALANPDGTATANDVMELAAEVRAAVISATGTALEPEPVSVG